MLSSTKEKTISDYVDNFRDSYKQGSDDWKEFRKGVIGGSQIATIRGENPYESIRKLVGQKIGIEEYQFRGNLYTNWGQTFEPLIKQYIEHVYSTRVYEIGIIPGLRDGEGNILQAYSPDGLAVIEDQITLLEFKCPFKRIPDGEIPEHYISQPKTGLCTIPIAERALFVDAMFRLCSVENFDMSHEYDYEFHGGVQYYEEPLALGLIGFYIESPESSLDDSKISEIKKIAIREYPIYLSTESANPYSDYYKMKKSDLCAVEFIENPYWIRDEELRRYYHYLDYSSKSAILDAISPWNTVKALLHRKIHPLPSLDRAGITRAVLGEYKAYYGKIYLPRDSVSWSPEKYYNIFSSKFSRFCRANKYTIVGMMPWKLMCMRTSCIDREDRYLDPLYDKIKNTVDNIRILKQMDWVPRIELFNRLYPK